jgi:hypothetical protein
VTANPTQPRPRKNLKLRKALPEAGPQQEEVSDARRALSGAVRSAQETRDDAELAAELRELARGFHGLGRGALRQ